MHPYMLHFFIKAKSVRRLAATRMLPEPPYISPHSASPCVIVMDQFREQSGELSGLLQNEFSADLVH